MASETRKTQSTVALNAKLTSTNLQAVKYDGSFTIEEGQPFVVASTGYAAAPTGTADPTTAPDRVVYINFVDSDRTDTQFTQTDPTDSSAPTRSIQGGGLTGIQAGGEFEVGLPAASWSSGALPAVGEGVYIDSSTKKFAAKTIDANDYLFGVVTRIDGGYAFFQFTSMPFKA